MELSDQERITIIRRLRRAQGQVGGVIRMIEDGQDCQQVITQLTAATKALDRAGFSVIFCGLKKNAENGEMTTQELAAMEKLFLSLA